MEVNEKKKKKAVVECWVSELVKQVKASKKVR